MASFVAAIFVIALLCVPFRIVNARRARRQQPAVASMFIVDRGRMVAAPRVDPTQLPGYMAWGPKHGDR